MKRTVQNSMIITWGEFLNLVITLILSSSLYFLNKAKS
jgi:hypothetical protein